MIGPSRSPSAERDGDYTDADQPMLFILPFNTSASTSSPVSIMKISNATWPMPPMIERDLGREEAPRGALDGPLRGGDQRLGAVHPVGCRPPAPQRGTEQRRPEEHAGDDLADDTRLADPNEQGADETSDDDDEGQVEQEEPDHLTGAEWSHPAASRTAIASHSSVDSMSWRFEFHRGARSGW